MDPTTRLYNVFKTVLRMLSDREYLIGEEELAMDFEDFRQKVVNSQTQSLERPALDLARTKRLDPSDRIFVFFVKQEKKAIGNKVIEEYLHRIADSQGNKGILVIPGKITTHARKVLQVHSGIRMEVFHDSELVVNITQHQLVPAHKPLNQAQKEALLARYKVKESQLPRIDRNDPVARYYGLVPGEVVRIRRPSETAGRYITYRLVV